MNKDKIPYATIARYVKLPEEEVKRIIEDYKNE